MDSELTEEQQTILRLCCEAASSGDLPYWEQWFSAKDVLSRYATQVNRREGEVAEALQSLLNQGYLVLPPVERAAGREGRSPSLPAACQVTGLGFEKYAEATFDAYLDWVEDVSETVAAAMQVSPDVLGEQLGLDPVVVAHILRYHELV